MPDLTSVILPELQNFRLSRLSLGDGYIYPAYTGRSILNVPSSVCSLLEAPGLGAEALDGALLSPLGGTARCVILVVIDALSHHRLRRWMGDGALPVWERLAQAGLLAPLTSIVPSTTSAALTSLWTGRSAFEHGLLGYEMWMKEYGVIANTILHSPMYFQGDFGSLERAGFNPETYLPFPTLGAHLVASEVKSYAFQNFSLLYSGLSKMFFKEVKTYGFHTAADLWVNLRQFMERTSFERQYIFVYWGEVDTLSHQYGPDDERPAAEFASFSQAFERLFLERLSPQARRDVVVMLTADHGQITTRQELHYELKSHPSLTRRLHLLPTGENRLAYLHVRPGQIEAVREYIERTWPNQFSVLDSAYAAESGLFGPGEPHPRLLERIGELVAVARGDAYWWWAEKENHMVGRHGGLHPDEMLVPFLAARL
jgi:predicted AlkP superfamily pyrophosphatase or phosphodiesterase